jgi:hypothetical protein
MESIARRVVRGEARRQQQRVAFAQRHVEGVGEARDHVAAGPRLAGLHAAEVARRNTDFQRQIKLADPPCGAPVAQQGANGLGHCVATGGRGRQPTPATAARP